MPGRDQDTALGELRREIDRIDAAMHDLLMERGRIIDRLIAVKDGTASSGSAFRPEREASMMRAMAERHGGALPFDAIESIWRIIISTFTHQQAPFSVHADFSGDRAAMRDSARYHFGFTVPLRSLNDAASVVRGVAASKGDLGIVPLSSSLVSAWWRGLEAPDAPKIIARLPFVDRPDHPAAQPVLVVAKSVSGEGLGTTLLYSMIGPAPETEALRKLGLSVIATHGTASILSAPREVAAEAIQAALKPASLVLIGSHPSTAPARSDR